MAPALTGRLVNEPQIRGTDLEVLWTYLLTRGPKTWTEMRQSFALQDADLLRSELTFLERVGLVDANRAGDEVTYRALSDGDQASNLSFRLRLLRALRNPRIDDGAFLAVWRYLVESETLLFRRNELRSELAEKVPIELKWTVEKVEAWEHLAEAVGLILPLGGPSAGTLVAPRPELILELLRLHAREHGPEVILHRWIAAVESEWLPLCTRRGELHPGVGKALLALETMGPIRIPPPPADMPRFVLATNRTAGYVVLEVPGDGVAS